MKNYIHSAGFVIYQSAQRELLFLLLHYNAGHWDFPKGKTEEGESLHETATRELFEETGLTPHAIGNFSYEYEYTLELRDGTRAKKRVTLFLAEVHKAPVILSNEHTDAGWFTFVDALTQLTHTNSKEALKAAHAYLRST